MRGQIDTIYLMYKCSNPILHGVVDQRMLHWREGINASYLTPKRKVMGTPNLACGLKFTEIGFELMASSS